MAYSYTEYTAASGNDTNTAYTTPNYLTDRGATDITVTVDGVTKTASTHYNLSGTSITFTTGNLPAVGAKIKITRSSSQSSRLNDYSDASLLTADTLDADANQLFFVAQEALDQASSTDFGAQTFYTSGTSAPSSATAGDLFFNTSTGILQVYTGSAFESVNNRGTKQTFAISGSTASFTPTTPVDDNTLVFLNGVLLVKGAGSAGDYTTSSTQVTLNTAVSSGVVEVVTFPNATNGTFTGTVTADALTMGDNEKITLGTGGDLEIYHSGSHSIIEDTGTGNLLIKADDLVLEDTNGNNFIKGTEGGTVQIWHNSAVHATAKLATTATGIDVNGTVTADGFTVGTGNNELKITTSGNDTFFTQTTSTGNVFLDANNFVVRDQADQSYRINCGDSDGVVLYGSGSANRIETGSHTEGVLFKTGASGGLSTRAEITNSGLTVNGTVTADGLTLGDSEYIRIGEGNGGIPDLRIFSGGTNAFIEQPSGSGATNLIIRGQNVETRNDADATLISCDADNVSLNWQGASGTGTKLATTQTGIDVTGTVTPSGGYKSSDGTAGFTGSASASATLTIKDGLIVAVS